MIGWLIEDIVRNTRHFIYKGVTHFYEPEKVKIQVASLGITTNPPSFDSYFDSSQQKIYSSPSILSLNQIAKEEMKNYKEYCFFYPDEKITCTMVYTSHKDETNLSPSQIIGTNVGRIFFISLF